MTYPSATSMLTVRRLPIFTERSGNEFKVRMDPALANLVCDSLQLKYPGYRIGRRWAIEFALMSWLHSEGLVKEAPVLPGCDKAGGSHGNHP